MTARTKQQPLLGPSAEWSSMRSLWGMRETGDPAHALKEHGVAGERAELHETSEGHYDAH